MEATQLANLYKANGITDYKLRSCDDLYKVHGIHYKSVNGYNRLETIMLETETYLRYEYKHRGRKEWLHVISEKNCY